MKELLEQWTGKPVKIYGLDNVHSIGGHETVTIKEVRDDALLISTMTGVKIVVAFSAVGSVWASD